VTVTPAVATEIFCRPANLQLTVDDTANYVVQALYTDLTIPGVDDASFVSSDTVVADFMPVDPVGVITALELGQTYVTATWTDPVGGETFEDVCDLEVVEALTVPDSCDDAVVIEPVDQTISGSTEEDAYVGGNTYSVDERFYSFTVDEVVTMDIRQLIPGEDYWDNSNDWNAVVTVTHDCYSFEALSFTPIVANFTTGEGGVVCLEPGDYSIVISGTVTHDEDNDFDDFTYEFDLAFGSIDTCYGFGPSSLD
jgi:hypothetical protein